MRRMILVASTFIAVAFLTVSSAQAQTPATASGSISPASSGHGRGLGVGAMTMLNGFDGALVTWGNAGGGYHVDGFFGLRHYSQGGTTTTPFSIGGRFWYHVHAAQFADFSLGGGLGLRHWNTNPGNPGNDSRLDLSLQVGGQIRAFVVPNVALLADLGLGVYFGPNDDILIGGQSVGGGGGGNSFVSGTLGIAYFFE